MKSNQRPMWREILGNPNGVEHGYPTDTRYASDTGIYWVKSRGFGTPFGWVPIGGGSAGGGMQELILDASVVALNPVEPIEGQENITVPDGFTAASRAIYGALSGLVVIVFPDGESEIACMFQKVLPLTYAGGNLQVVLELAGDGISPAGEAEMYALITAEPEGSNPDIVPLWGTEIDLTTEISGGNIILASSTISGGQLDSLVAGNAFRILIGLHPGDEYSGSVSLIRGRIRELAS